MEYDKNICDWTVGDEVEGFYLLKAASSRTTAGGKPYLSGTVADCSGSAEAVIWDYSGPVDSSDTGKVIKLRGQVSLYRGSLQLTMNKIRLPNENDRYDISRLLPTAPINVDARLEEIRALIASMDDEGYRAVAGTMLERHLKAFRTIPAAKSVHHSFLAGLLMHTSNMLRLADFLADLYSETVDRDLLLTGTLLHDFAKEREFSFSELGLVTDYSTAGQLLGHLVMGAQETAAVAAELGLNEEKSLLLQHMILSHHGEPEFGAAVRPMCAEAELLSEIDKIDSRMEIYAETLAEMNPGQVSDRIFALEKKIYKHF